MKQDPKLVRLQEFYTAYKHYAWNHCKSLAIRIYVNRQSVMDGIR